ncbi:MAG: diphosphomevalonate decarboxylase [Candidatus Gottesmanbacteria bacterium]
MLKATAIAPANIAFIKYWGQKDKDINLPFNNSISMNLDKCLTTTTVEFSKDITKDVVMVNNKTLSDNDSLRVIKQLDTLRKLDKINFKAQVVSINSFPSDAGIASSASSFAALALAGAKALGVKIKINELSCLARLGSGSACRSIPDGFGEWHKGKNHTSSYARSLYRPDWWDLTDIVVIVSNEKKKYSSLSGHASAESSPYFINRLKQLPRRISQVKKALKEKNLPLLGETIEEEAIDLHVIAMTSKPPIFYWNGTTMEIIKQLKNWRSSGLLAYFTIDAGPNLHIICEQKQEKIINKKLKDFPGVIKTIINHPGKGARII